MKFRFVSVLLVTAALVGCGGSGSDKLSAAVSKAVYDSTREQDPPFDISQKSADCVAETLLGDKATKSLLQKAFDDGKTGKDLMDVVESDETDTLMNCMSKDEIETIMNDVFIKNLTEDQEALQCMSDAIGDFTVAELREMFIGISKGDFETDAFLKFSDTMTSCGVSSTPTEAEVTSALAQALYEANQNNTDVPFKVSQAEAQCVAEALMADSALNAVYTQAFKDGKTGKDFVKTEGSDSDKSTIASINCLGKDKLVSAMGAVIKDATAATTKQIKCFEQVLGENVNVEGLRAVFLDLQDNEMSTENNNIINNAANQCGIAG